MTEREWQPIETAPAANGPSDDRILVVGGCYPKPELVLPDGDWWRMRKAQGGKTFTHWMPLPGTPKAYTYQSPDEGDTDTSLLAK